MKIAFLNTENLFISPEDGHKYAWPLKQEEKTKKLALALQGINADIVGLCEVGGNDSLQLFNHNYLNQAYNTSLIRGNSERGIELAIMTKKDLPYRFEHYTHKNRPIDQIGTKFSRDIAELRIFNKDEKLPMLILLIVHLKSQRDTEGDDPHGVLKRSLEFKLLLNTYKALHKKFNHKVPIMLAGDFNGNASKDKCDKEFANIYKDTDLKDILDILDIPEKNKTTLIFFNKDGKRLPLQFDYIFIPQSLHSKVNKKESGVYRYRNDLNRPIKIPTLASEKFPMPSDHYPVVVTFEKNCL